MEIEEEFISGFAEHVMEGRLSAANIRWKEIKEPSHLWIVHMTDV